MEAVDTALGRLIEAADKYGYTLLITADHGNADQMTETKKGKTSIRTAHSLNPVPFIIYDKDNNFENQGRPLRPCQRRAHGRDHDGADRARLLAGQHGS